MLRTAMLFQDGCVLQRGKPCAVFGTARPGAAVTVTVQGKTATAEAAADGNWKAVLPPLAASRCETLTVTCEGETLVYKSVAVGEVWLLGGQSNMEFHMRYDEALPEEEKGASHDRIRFFDVPEISYEGQERDFDYSRFGVWRTVNPTDLEYFSAVGYYFAKQLEQTLQVPVGLVGINWGGTPSCAWMSSAEVLQNGPAWLEDYERELKETHLGLAGDYVLHPEWNALTPEEQRENPVRRAAYALRYRKDPANNRGDLFGDAAADELLYGMCREKQLELLKLLERQAPPAEDAVLVGPLHQNRPGGLYETMLRKAAPYTARGVLWYQGESDSFHPELHAKMLSGVISSWRSLWRDTLPFYLVQLAPFEAWLQCVGDAFPLLREQEKTVAETVERVYLVCTADVGMRYDIHPKQKKPVGERLAFRALAEEYERQGQPRSPEYDGIVWEKEACAVLRFRYADGGLYAEGNPGREFELIRDGKRMPLEESGAVVKVDGNTVQIRFPATNPGSTEAPAQTLLYGQKPYFVGNLFSAAGLPVFPFET